MKNFFLITIFLTLSGIGTTFAQVVFNFTGGSQNYVVPPGVTVICFTVNGAQGMGNVVNNMGGGLGGRVMGSIPVVAGQVLQINVGGGGIASNLGGFNGGANGGVSPCANARGGGGGGASDIRFAPYGLANRFAVGGGGGGTGGNRIVGCGPGCGGGGGGGYYGGGGGGAYGGMPGFGGTQVAGGAGGTSCCGCPNAPQPGTAGVLGAGGPGGGVGANNQAANNPGCAGGVGGALVGGQGPNCTGGGGCPSTWAGASGAGGSNFASGAVIGPAHAGGVNAGNGSVILIPNCCVMPTITPVANPNPICSGQTATLTATGAGIGGTYTWTPGPLTGSMVTVTPAASTIYTVSGTTTLACVGTNTILLTVSPSPTALPASNSPVCTGGPLNLTVNAATSYTWLGPNGFTSNLQNPIINNVTAANAGNYTVTVTGPTGCTATAVTNVVVNPTPIILPGNTGPYCVGAAINLTVAAAATYTWTGPNAFLSNLQNPVIPNSTAVNAGVYTVSVTALGGCQSVGTTTVVLNPLPTPIANSNNPVCNGSPLNLTGLGGVTYTWSGPGGYASNAQNPVIAAATFSNAGSYTLTVSNANGCTNSVVTNVIINALPAIVVNSPTTCVGSTFTLTATGGTAYAWTGPNAFNSALQNPPFANATTNLSGNYTVFVTSAQGCTNTAVANVQVVTLPTVSIVGTNTLCAQNFNGSSNTVNLTASGATTFTWSLPPGYGATPNLNNPVVTITPSATSVQNIATVSVIGSAGSCTSSAIYTLTVIPNPTITVSSASMCAGTSVTLTVNNASTYTWTPVTALNTTNGPVVIANPTVTTVYSVIGTSVGCNSQTQNGTASVVPNPTVTIAPANPVVCLGNSINLTAAGATDYTWTPNTALSAITGPNTTATPVTTITYSVLGSQATCTNMAAITVTVLGLPSVTVTPSSPTLCMNNFNGSPNTVSLTASGATTYTWGPIIGLTPNTLNGATIIGTSNGAAVGTGTVIGANGTCTNLATFTVNASPNPVITVSSASMCAGTSVTLTANNASTYTWTPLTALNTTNGPVVIANPTVTTVYSVIGTSVGCNSQTQNGTASVVPNPTVNIAPANPTICIGSSIALTGNGAINYTWSPNTAITTTLGANVVVSPTTTTTYTLLGEQATCTNVAITTVTVFNLPAINVITASPTLCMNNFNGSSNTVAISAVGATTYTWTGFNGLVANTINGANIIATSILNTPVATGTVMGTANTCTNIATFTVAAIPNPIISVTSASMCLGTNAVLNANGASSYVWSPATFLNASTGNSVIANPNVTTVYSVIGSSLNCNSTTETGTVTVVASPTITINSAGVATICAGTPIALSGAGAATYTWFPANTVDNSNNANVIATPLSTTNYVLVGSLNTCTASAIMQVTVIALPTLQAAVQNTAICFGGKTSMNANGASNYTWSPSAGLADPSANFVVVSPQVPTMYTLIGNNGLCTASLNVFVDVVPNPVISLSTSNQKICEGAKSTIFASGAAAYSWTPNENINFVTPNVGIVSPSVSTNYTIMGYNFSGTLGCSMTQEILIDVVSQVTANVSSSVSICEGESVRLNAGGRNTYVWSPSTGLNNANIASPYANPKTTTIYTVNVSDGGFCAATATVLVAVGPKPNVYAGPDQKLNMDEPMYLNASGTGTMKWIFGEGILCHDCPNSQIITENSGTYIIETINEFGCKAQDEVYIEVTKEYAIYIPNVFTPNFDGVNDVFMVYGTGILKIEMTIFDRWGEKLFFSEEQLKGWDGTFKGAESKQDVYTYLINYTSLDNKKHTRTGHVTLMK